MGRVVPGASCLWSEMTVGRVLMGRVVRVASFDGASCPGTVFFQNSALSLQNPAIKATAIKFVSNKPFRENFSANCLIIMKVPAYFVSHCHL
jgi:hypothetical protein